MGVQHNESWNGCRSGAIEQIEVGYGTTADANVGQIAANGICQTVPDQQEVERRRELVRMLFNDFWNGAYNKPVAFAQRLDEAEDYLNARLAAHGEFWRLDADTRAILGLPPRSSSPD
jgi:hypothetical protein